METVGIALVALAMAVGLVGTLLPLLPGLALIWAAALAYGLATGFGTVGTVALSLITVLLAASLVAKVVLPQRGARAGGAPPSTLLVGAALGVVGFFAIPVVGLPLGAVLGVLLVERARTGDWRRARRSTRGVVVGFGIGALVELGAGIVMILTWVVWVLVTR
jgi:uncharacterized protein